MDKLLDPDTDYILMETLKNTTIPTFAYASFQRYVESKYQHLSKYVHFGGQSDIDESFRYLFPEFNERLFKEWIANFNEIIEICNLITVTKFPTLAEVYPQVQKERGGEQVPLLTDEQIDSIKTKLAA